jgi:multidrug resistance efflux pump
MAQLEEEFETLEAHRDVKKAIVRAAEVAVRAAKASYELIAKGPTAYPQQEVDKAKFSLEAAEAQLEIRVAEMKEVEVKIKHARKRLEDAKAAGARPAPGIIRPEETLPIGPPPVAKEQQAKIELLTQVVAERRADLQKCEADLKLAEAELTRILEIAKIGRVRAGVIEAAQANAEAARAAHAKAAAELKECEDALAKAKGNRR